MCTVSYLPTPSGFILTHNRDEAPRRSPRGIERHTVGTDALIFPRDTGAGGTWIAAARSGRMAFVLNGAWVKHQHRPPYRRSRGLMLLDFFEIPDAQSFFKDYDLNGIEPFTFVAIGDQALTQLRWDGTERYLAELPLDQAAFWCSATLYPPEMQGKREKVFQLWLQATRQHGAQRNLAAKVLNLHYTGSVDDPENDYVMNRDNRVRTVSITQVVRKDQVFRMQYNELLEGLSDKSSLQIRAH